MQLSNLKNLYIQNSLSKNINLRKKSEIQIRIIELYKSKYNAEPSDEVGISLAAEEIKEEIKEIGIRDNFYKYRLEAVNSCIIKYLTIDELSIISRNVGIKSSISLKEFYNLLLKIYPKEMKQAKREDILKVYSLLEVAFDSANTNNS